jgi:hypothetical protein
MPLQGEKLPEAATYGYFDALDRGVIDCSDACSA